MASEVLMPKLGATMEKGTITRWYKKEGEPVLAGEPLVEIMTDKVSIDVESTVSGNLIKILYAPDDIVNVQQTIAYIGEAGEVVNDSPSSTQKDQVLPETGSAAKIRATPAARKLARKKGIQLELAEGSGPRGRIQVLDVKNYLSQLAQPPRVTPLAHKIAEKENIDLKQVAGTGVGGKIVRDDVLTKVNEKAAAIESVKDTPNKIKIEGLRKIIAGRMVQNAFTAPHVTLVSEADMSKIMEIREQLIPVVLKQADCRLSFTEVLIKITAFVLKKNPMVNASLQGDYIVLNSQVNIGIAVAVPNGLMVPVIQEADQKGLLALTMECKSLTKLAREGKLQPDQVSTGTFTISNLGMFAVDAFTPIINSPETAILGIGRINQKPVGIDGKIELRPMMTLSLSFDHRVIDGAPAAAFLTELKETLENPYLLMV